MAVNEADTTKAFLARVRRLPHVRLWRNNVGARPGIGTYGVGGRGGADFLGLVGGRFVAAEIKGKGGRMSDHQRRFMQTVSDHGGIYLLVTPDNLDELYTEMRSWAAGAADGEVHGI